MQRSLFALFPLLILLGSCYRPAPPQAFEDMKALEGTWTTVEGPGFRETWKVVNDTLIRGTGYSLNNRDTVFSEQLKIRRAGGIVYYAAKPGDQKSYVQFKLEKAGRDYWKFENPSHDYPNVIEYVLKNKQTLIARTSNTKGNKVVEFIMKRTVQ